MGFEPTAFSLARRCSTTKLRPLAFIETSDEELWLTLPYPILDQLGGPGRIRTDDLLLAKQAPSRLATGPSPRRLAVV